MNKLFGNFAAFVATILACFLCASAYAGFSISGTQLLDANGNPFIMRGVNHPHAWYNYRTSAFKDIAVAGANTVRVVLSDGQQFTKNEADDVARVINACKRNRLICVLEVHDVTGSGEKAEAGTLANAAAYWVEIADVLKGQEDFAIINIANEPFGNGVPASEYVSQHQNSIETLRAAGLTHTLMIDAANWGQDWQEIMLDNASIIAAADPLENTLFSVHMYQVYPDRAKIEGYVTSFLNTHQLPLVIGEFGPDHQGHDVDEDSILAVSEEYGIGYLGWSWSGNTGDGTETLDMTVSFDPTNFTPWGDRLFNGPNGIVATSLLATVYEGQVIEPPKQCDWYGSIVPICEFIEEGHGYENGGNCVGILTCRAQDGSGGVIGEEPTDPVDPIDPVDPPATSNCAYEIMNQWNNGFEARITISNAGATSVEGWEVHWHYDDGSAVSSSWNANVTENATNQAISLSWNASIPSGGSVSFGFTGSGPGTSVTLAGPSCL